MLCHNISPSVLDINDIHARHTICQGRWTYRNIGGYWECTSCCKTNMAAVSPDEPTFEQSLVVFSRSRTLSNSIMVLCSARISSSYQPSCAIAYCYTGILRYFICTSGVAAIFDLLVTATPERVQISPTMLLDPENVGVAFRTSSLSCIEVEILRYFIRTSG